MTYRLRNIAIAVALAVLAAMIVSFYVKQQKEEIVQGQTQVTVYVATDDIPVGTAGSEISSLVEPVQVAKDAVAPAAIATTEDLEGKVSTEAIYANEQVSLLRFSDPTEQGLRSKLSGPLRAVQVPGDEHQLLAGTLKDGDRVDLVANLKYKLINFGKSGGGGVQDNVATRTVLRDILVLQAPLSSTDTKRLSADSSDKFVILALTDAQEQKFFFVAMNGDWTLQLRPTKDPADSPESIETVATVLGDGLTRAQINQLLFRLGRNEEGR